MRRRISDHDIEQLLTGAPPGGAPELLAVAEALEAARTVAFETVARPSAELAARLDVSDEVSATGAGAPVAPTRTTAPALAGATSAHSRGKPTMIDRIAGLGLAAKIAAGTGVLALGLTGVGAAGALPGPVQDAFDTAVETVLPQTEEELVDEDVLDEDVVDDTLPVGSDEFSTWVSENAKDPDKVGKEFGAAVSEQARELRDEKAAERAEERAEEPAGELGDDESVDDAPSTGKPEGAGKPDHAGKPDTGDRGKRP